jgi:uncharacterized protein YndB with AHSA1/START domain
VTSDTRSQVVEVRKRIAASPATIFRHLSDPVRFAQWIDARVAIEPAVGKPVEIAFHGCTTVAHGVITELVPDRRLVFTWGITGGGALDELMPPGSTTVTIELEPVDGGTLVTLRHEGLPAEERHDHEVGWDEYLDNLSGLAAKEEAA